MHFSITSSCHALSLQSAHLFNPNSSAITRLYVLSPSFVQFTEIVLTGCGKSQAPNLFDTADKRGKYGLVHNLGLGGAAVISLLRRPEFFEPSGEDGRTRYAFQDLFITIVDL